MRSCKVFIVSLEVCKSDTIVAEYDVMMKTLRISMKKNTILEEMFFGLCKASEIAIIIIIIIIIH